MRTARTRLLLLALLAALVAAGAVFAILAPLRGDVGVATAGPGTALSGGITFDHATLNDPVRMVGEPDIVIDHKGGLYVSGPGGSTTQASWFWKSDDKGIQWHSIGVIPEGKSNGQNGGGDTEYTIAGNNDVFSSDLQTLTCNSTQRSLDEGNTFTTSEGCLPDTDRQWMSNYDPTGTATGRRIYLVANHGEGITNCDIVVSTDNGLTYLPPDSNTGGSVGPHCIGHEVVDPTNGDIYVPNSDGIYKSTNGGSTFTRVGSSGAEGHFFASLFMDTAGNLYQAWVDSPNLAANHAFISVSTDHGVTWTKKQVSTGPSSPVGTSPDLRQIVFPWGVAGDPGRVAVAYYGTNDTGKNTSVPAYGGPNANWQTYVSFSTDLVTCTPTCSVNPSAHFTQVQATEHPNHRGPVCLGGFPNCLTANSDRSMADFFEIDKDPTGRVYIAYNENSDLSLVVPDPPEYIGKPINAVIRLRTGPSLFADQGNLLPDPKPANIAVSSADWSGGNLSVKGTQHLPAGNWTTDAAGDARFPVVPVAGANQPALDIREVSAGDDGTNLTFKLKMADLSQDAVTQAVNALGSPSWMVTWWQGMGGLGPTNMSAPYHSHWFVKWLGGTNFVYGKVSSVDLPALGAPTPKILTYTPSGTTTGSVDGNQITMSVPLADLGGLAAGDKIDHVTAYGLSEHDLETLPAVVDQAKTFSYRIGTPAAGQHGFDGYVEVSLDSSFANSTRAALNADGTWTASIASPSSGTVYARQVLSNELYTPLWDDVQAGPADQLRFFSADLSVTQTKSPDPAYAGQPLTYTVTVHNGGPDPAVGATLTDNVPAGVTFGSATASQGSCSGTSTVTCNLGTVASGADVTLTLVVTPTLAAVGTIGNTASATSATLDPDTSNNSSTTTSVVKPAADLQLAQQADQSTAHVDKAVTYTITVTNRGPSSAAGLTLTDTFSTNASFYKVSAVRGKWTCKAQPDKRLVNCALSGLSAGDYAVVKLVVKPKEKGTLTNTASVSSSSPTDPVSGNNSSTLQIPVT